jgi:ParB/RepB/Spo0J family partition protein
MQEKAKIEYVDPHNLKVPEVRITSEFEQEILEMFGDDIEKVGIEQPLLIARDNEILWVIDGKHRRDEALLKGIPKVPCVIRAMDLKNLQLRNLMSNRLRGKTKVSEEIKVLKDLFETHEVSIEELVTKTGMRRERVEQLLKVSTVHPDILKGLEDEKISLCAAYAVSALPDEESQLRMLAIIEQYNLKCSDVKEAVNDTIRIIAERNDTPIPPDVPLPPGNPEVQCQFCKEMVDVRDASSPIICRMCYGTVIGAILQAKKEIAEETERDVDATIEAREKKKREIEGE